GCVGASEIVMTGAKQASLPSSSACHSRRGFDRTARSKAARSCARRDSSCWASCRSSDMPIGRFVGTVVRMPAIEHVRAPLFVIEAPQLVGHHIGHHVYDTIATGGIHDLTLTRPLRFP